jgi:hypothetical protein
MIEKKKLLEDEIMAVQKQYGALCSSLKGVQLPKQAVDALNNLKESIITLRAARDHESPPELPA